MNRFREELEMSIGSIIRKMLHPQSKVYKNLQILYRYLLSVKRTRKLKLLKFGILLSSHCNLNCAGCGNYSPLAPERFYDIDTFREDCKRLSYLTGRKIGSIGLAGGEPLLHPRITEFFDTARYFFDKHVGGGGYIGILSNGILLAKQPETFWESCRKNDVEIEITKYPIKLDFNSIEQTAKNHNVKFSYYQNTDKITKWTNVLALDLEGRQNINDSFRLCFEANECITLHNGRLYTCARRAAVSNFNSYFKANLEEADADSIDIYKAKNIDEIFDFLRRPIPFCRYCNWRKIILYTPWHTSKKDISEWTVC